MLRRLTRSFLRTSETLPLGCQNRLFPCRARSWIETSRGPADKHLRQYKWVLRLEIRVAVRKLSAVPNGNWMRIATYNVRRAGWLSPKRFLSCARFCIHYEVCLGAPSSTALLNLNDSFRVRTEQHSRLSPNGRNRRVPPMPQVAARVCFLNPQPALSLGRRNSSSCPRSRDP
jgi:hypothetical protein